VSVVVCSRDRPALLDKALAAVTDDLRPDDELIVVDSASRNDDTAAVGASYAARTIRLATPGLARARNAGIDTARADLVAFTDDDCVIERGWLDAIVNAFSDRTGVVLGRVLPVSDDAAAPADDPGPVGFSFGPTAIVDELGAGANMAFRRAALTDIGDFDEQLGAGTRLRSGEDHDAIWRALRARWLGRYEPGARVVHADWRSTTDLMRMRYGYGLGAGAVAAKMIKVDPHAGWRELRRRAWDKGIRSAPSHLARGWERPAAGDALYTAGVVVGAAAVWRQGLVRGHLA
jgi:glycosyltransferase involved in cell wall biosynthesis